MIGVCLFLLATFSEQYFVKGGLASSFVFIVAILGFLYLLSCFFEIVFWFKNKTFYSKISKTSTEDIYIVENPYLPFLPRSNQKHSLRSPSNYPLNSNNKYYFPAIGTNSLGLGNGLDGKEEASLEKSKLRVLCLGASTTGNYIQIGSDVYSYPLLLQKHLDRKKPDFFEVINGGVGGFNSADLLVHYALKLQNLKPDFVIIYHGYNDIRHYLSSKFSSDYSHSLKSWRLSKLAKWIIKLIPNPDLPLLNFISHKLLDLNIRNSLLRHIFIGDFSIKNDPTEGLETYHRNVKNLVRLIKGDGGKVVLSTFCHYLYPAIKETDLHRAYSKIIGQENSIIKGIAKKENCILIDMASLLKKDEKFFLDSIHFSPEGMDFLAENFSTEILKSV